MPCIGFPQGEGLPLIRHLRDTFPPRGRLARQISAYKRADGSCAICGTATNRLEAHEQWSYDEITCTQKLTGVIAICKSCHEVIHIGRTSLKGGEERASAHFMRVNGCNYAEYRKALGRANEEHRRRNTVADCATSVGAFVCGKADGVPLRGG